MHFNFLNINCVLLMCFLCLNFQKTFEIECDASRIGVCAVLMQKKKLNAYFSKKLNDVALKYPAYVNELYAFVRVLQI